MNSDPKTPREMSAVKRLFAALNERRAWEATNNQPVCACHPQGLAAAWTEALGIDAAVDQQRDWERQQRGLLADAAFHLQKHGVPPRAAKFLSRADDRRPGIRAARQWLADVEAFQPFLVLLGEPGTGKTVAAAYAAQFWLGRYINAPQPTASAPRERLVWTAAAELASLSNFQAGDREWIERMERAGLLVLDDVGAEALHEHAQARLERLMDIRYSTSRPTLITSNCNAETLKARVGARISDRIREAGRVVNCGNVSLRGVKP